MNNETINLNLIRKVLEVSDPGLFPLYAKEVFRDLIDRAESSKKGVSRATFYGYMKLPVLIADKLFNALDEDRDGNLNLKEFTEGLTKLYYGSFKESASIIFKMYDFDRDEIIHKVDIKILFSYLPLKNEELQMESLDEIDSILNNINIEAKFTFQKFMEVIEKSSDIYLQLICFLYEHKPFSNDNIEVCKYFPKKKDSDSKTKLALGPDPASPISKKKAKSSITESVALSSPSRSTMFKSVENIINMLKIEEVVTTVEERNEIKLPIKYLNPYTKPKLSASELKLKEMIRMPNQREFKDRTIISSPSKYLKNCSDKDSTIKLSPIKTPSKKRTSSVIFEEKSSTSKSGIIFKLTESRDLKPFFLKLFNKDIFYYRDGKCKELIGMHNLSGCFISDLKDNKFLIGSQEYFSFSIIFSKKTRVYLVDSLTEAEDWVKCLKGAIGYQSFSDQYIMESKTLGEGKFGLVKRGVHKKTGEKVAIKIIKKTAMTPKDHELVKSEVDIMKICRHQNIVRLLDHFEDNEFIFIVMEYLSGGTLAHFLETNPLTELSEKEAAKIIYQIAKALEYLHQFGIIHRDLKPENILIKGGLPFLSMDSIKVMDFGLSKILGLNERVNDGYGTLTYVAPEVLTRKPYNRHVDIWSLGVITYYMLSGTFPFSNTHHDEELIAKKIAYHELKFYHDSWRLRSPSLLDFIEVALTKDLEKRATISDILSHKWFIDSNINSHTSFGNSSKL